MTEKILIVEDEVVTQNTLKDIFLAEGYEVDIADNETTTYQILQNKNIDLVLMDINIPGKNGLTLGRELIQKYNLNLVFLTGRDDDLDKILGLEIGADDYITKPFNIRELTIRVRNLLKRKHQAKQLTKNKISDLQEEPTGYNFSGWHFYPNKLQLISPSDKIIKLPKSQYKLLLFFCKNPNTIILRKDLLFTMTGKELRKNDRSVDVTIRRIREIFEAEGFNDLITTMHGEGYLFSTVVKTK